MSAGKSLSRRAFWVLVVLVAAAQTAALAYVVVGRDRLLKHGREIVIPVQPLDPRDLFRGDYVTLGYPITQISNVAGGAAPGQPPPGIARGDTFYAVLKPADGETWTVARVSASFPSDVAPEEVVLRGRVRQIYAGAAGEGPSIVARYGIETYFVPEGEGKVLEKQVLERSIKAILAVGSNGEAALKGLIVDGERREHPPIF